MLNKAPNHEDVWKRGGTIQAVLTSALNEAESIA